MRGAIALSYQGFSSVSFLLNGVKMVSKPVMQRPKPVGIPRFLGFPADIAVADKKNGLHFVLSSS